MALNKYLFIPLFFVCYCFSSCKETTRDDESAAVKAYYISALRETDSSIHLFNAAVLEKKELPILKALFRNAKLSYKKTELLTEYIHPEIALLLNGPAVPEVEVEDHLNTIIPPEGFQVIEALLFDKDNNVDMEMLGKESGKLDVIANNGCRVAAAVVLSDSLIFKALRKELIRIICLGVTGYDSDVSHDGILESRAAWRAVNDIIAIYYSRLHQHSTQLEAHCRTLLEQGDIYLNNNSDFNGFDRMEFIRRYANPLSGSLKEVCEVLRIDLGGGYTSVRPTAGDIFDRNAFDINFFTDNIREHYTPEKAALGKQLFFDPVLSGNGQMSCGSCHRPDKAFADGEVRSQVPGKGIVTKRNTPTLYNAGLQSALFYDLRVSYLEDQVTDVLSNKDEMHGSATLVISRIRSNQQYIDLFKKAFPGVEEPLTPYHLQNAIGSYIRSLVSFNAPFDRYMRGDSTEMNKEEIAGFNLYMGKAKCGACHFAPLFNGLLPPDFVKNESEVIGVPKDTFQKKVDEDKGYYMVYAAEPYLYAFKTPTLRNIVLTAPYMHNGVYKTLEEVLTFYNNGGGVGVGIHLSNQTLSSEKLQLSKTEQNQIIAFLGTLTDTSSMK